MQEFDEWLEDIKVKYPVKGDDVDFLYECWLSAYTAGYESAHEDNTPQVDNYDI